MVDHSVLTTTILLLVSDPVVRSVLQETLQRQGYSVQSAGDLGTAVDRLKECSPDLLIVRTYVESITGHEAAMYLRTKNPGMKVLMLGGILADERLEDRAERESFEIFPKPYSAAALLEEVRRVLSTRRG